MGWQLVGTYARNKKTEFANSLQTLHNALIIKGEMRISQSLDKLIPVFSCSWFVEHFSIEA